MAFCSPRRASPSSLAAPLLLLILGTSVLAHGCVAAAGGALFDLRRKIRLQGAGGGVHHLADLRKHDARRHLSGVDVPLGGNTVGDKAGLYFTELEIGTPGNAYHLEVDTGTGSTVVNCVDCLSCPSKNSLRMKLKLYNPNTSQSASTVLCGDIFCLDTNNGMPHGCIPTSPCPYSTTSGNGRSTYGFFVKDLVKYNRVSGDGQTTPTSTAITFGCGAKLAQDLGSPDQALDGILGFGRSNSSMLSQLAAAGQARRIFAHCLDTANGGGIFAIGNIVQPKVKTTPLVPNMKNYNIKLKSIDVDGTTLPIPPDTFSGEGKGTVIDSGRTLVYLPDMVYKTITVAVFEKHPETLFHDFQDFLCFQYSGRIDDMFPKIVFHFEGDLLLNVYPHDYFLPNGSDWYCLGLRTGRSLQDMKDMVILGDLVLSNKLVVYDLEAQVLGWTDYDCVLICLFFFWYMLLKYQG